MAYRQNRQGRLLGSRIWRFLSSIRLALILILVIAGMCLAGALLIQVPPEVAINSQSYSIWLRTVAGPKFGFWTWSLQLFGLFNVFHSPLFLGAGTLLIANIIACSVNRWKSLSKATTLSSKPGDEFYKSATGSTELALKTDLPESTQLIISVLKKAGYRLHIAMAPDTAYINADKNSFSRYGTLFSHLSLILFIIAFFVSSSFGFKDTCFIVPEGTMRQVGHNTGLSLRLDSFTDEYWQDGMPKDYRSQVVLYQNGEEVERGSIRVNHPITYNGVNFYQSSFGPAALIEVRHSSGQEIFRDTIALSNPSQISGYMFYSGSFALTDQDLSVQLVGTEAGNPAEMGNELAIQVKKNTSTTAPVMDIIEKGIPHDIAGLQFTYIEESQYSGFQVSRDPGNVLIWIASAMFMVGLVMVLYFSYQRVWVQVQNQHGGTRIRLRLSAPRSQRSDAELIKLKKGVEQGRARNR